MKRQMPGHFQVILHSYPFQNQLRNSTETNLGKFLSLKNSKVIQINSNRNLNECKIVNPPKVSREINISFVILNDSTTEVFN